MTERQKVTKYVKILKEKFPGIYVYKPGDSFGGHKKPFDICGCYRGYFFSVEFKNEGGKLSPHQVQAGKDVFSSGGQWFYLVFVGALCMDGAFISWLNSIKGVSE